MTSVSADDLDKSQVAKLREFLSSKLQTEFAQHGSVIDLDDLKARDIKLLLHKFLRANGLDDYRVLNHEGVLEIVHLEQADEKDEKPEDLKPSMPGPIAGIPHTVKPSDMVEWSTHPWERKSSRKKD